MSRTRKDKPSKFKYDPYDKDRLMLENWYWRELKTTKPKKRRSQDTEWHWMGTPSWWNHLFHTKPRRKASQMWAVKALHTNIEDLDLLHKPNYSNKPHSYFY